MDIQNHYNTQFILQNTSDILSKGFVSQRNYVDALSQEPLLRKTRLYSSYLKGVL